MRQARVCEGVAQAAADAVRSIRRAAQRVRVRAGSVLQNLTACCLSQCLRQLFEAMRLARMSCKVVSVGTGQARLASAVNSAKFAVAHVVHFLQSKRTALACC